MNSNLISDLLLKNVVTVRYLKQDGSTRNMICTKSYDLLDSFEGRTFLKYHEPKNTSRKVPNNLIVVWDVDSYDYRMIYPDKILDIESIIPCEEFRNILKEKYIS